MTKKFEYNTKDKNQNFQPSKSMGFNFYNTTTFSGLPSTKLGSAMSFYKSKSKKPKRALSVQKFKRTLSDFYKSNPINCHYATPLGRKDVDKVVIRKVDFSKIYRKYIPKIEQELQLNTPRKRALSKGQLITKSEVKKYHKKNRKIKTERLQLK